ncbi:MFS transporter [Agromyces atrinae]|uniref:MFS transporter n=1 Tax=Agromyces atrinae TaxID=592376 RepID=UPI001F59AB84|nr:MFS transporter [Agromyces atrinae]MCI2957539.1 MFS transporter [Agromyces atrinae]
MNRADRLALLCCIGAGFATLLDTVVIGYAVPSLSQGLDASTADLQWLLAAYSLTFGLGLVPGGRLGDAYGRRELLLVGLAIFLAGSAAAGLAGDVVWVVAARFIQGFGAGLVSAQVLGIIQDRFSGADRVRAFAAYSIAGATAGILGPVIAGVILALVPGDWAWRLLLTLSAPFVALTLALAWRFIPRVPPAPRRIDLDLPAVLLLGAVVVIVTLPVIDPGVGRSMGWLVAAVVLVLVSALVVWEIRYRARGRVPLFAPELVRSAGFVSGNLVALLWFGAVVGHGTIITLFLLDGFGLAALAVAIALIPSALSRIVASSLTSRLHARISSRTIPLALGVTVLALGGITAVVLTLDGAPLVIAIVLVEVVLGAASGILEPPLRATTLGFAPAGFHGVAASFLQLTQRLAATFFLALLTGVLFTADGAGASRTSLATGTVICGILVLVAFGISLAPALHRRPVFATLAAHPA